MVDTSISFGSAQSIDILGTFTITHVFVPELCSATSNNGYFWLSLPSHVYSGPCLNFSSSEYKTTERLNQAVLCISTCAHVSIRWAWLTTAMVACITLISYFSSVLGYVAFGFVRLFPAHKPCVSLSITVFVISLVDCLYLKLASRSQDCGLG